MRWFNEKETGNTLTNFIIVKLKSFLSSVNVNMQQLYLSKDVMIIMMAESGNVILNAIINKENFIL